MRKNTFSDDVKKFLENSGQFISFGVLEKYHKVTDETSGLTISNLLMKKVFEHFTERKKGSFFLLGLKSNVRAIKYYEKYKGFTLPDDIGESVIVKFRVFLRIWGPPDSTITGRVKTDG